MEVGYRTWSDFVVYISNEVHIQRIHFNFDFGVTSCYQISYIFMTALQLKLYILCMCLVSVYVIS